MKHDYVYLAGLPRSGSTLLANILAQNKKLYPTPTSGVPELVIGIRDGWGRIAAMRASQAPLETKRRVTRGVIDSYYQDVKQPVIVDKSRVWPILYETLDWMFNKPPKIVVTVRDLPECVASFEKLFRKHNLTGSYPIPPKADFSSVGARVKFWQSPQGEVGAAYNILLEASNRGLAPKLHWVEFTDLTNDPETALKKLYEYIEQPYFEHDFNNVEQTVRDNDDIWGIPSLHKIRPKVAHIIPYAPTVIGQFGEELKGKEFWRRFTQN